ncbi:IclR family transcriptional regulator [Haloarcula nitratireducens]|uniref:IclR family transcriptional regulator n=1 Tax=Haloarcula nitratireducens TaxID=2487749 RepID=A0AAW4PHT6_9EURY|nr:IclR family transcriptional regulator [Halomicroarcula nitratireducens]MBX0297499.1 IclR family transcriptional regulator [Halomicroarcula nitratireducens]
MPDQANKTINSVETTLDILSALSGLEPITLSELATHVEVPTSTLYIHLNTLIERGYVVKESNEYRRSFRFLEHGGSVRQQLDASQLLQNKVEEISRKTGEIAGVGLEENGRRVIAYRSSGKKAAGDEIPIGNHTHMHWTSLGKAILANLPPEKRDEIVENSGLPVGTDNTLDSPQELETELEQIREQGYAIDDEEHLRGVRGIAVPIFDEEQDVLVSFGITGPRDRFTTKYMANLLDVLRYAKNEIEVQNQYHDYRTIDG